MARGAAGLGFRVAIELIRKEKRLGDATLRIALL